MAGWGMLIGGAGFALDAIGTIRNHNNRVSRDEASIAQAQQQVLRNNQLAERNFQLINEEKQAAMVANKLDKFDIAKQIRRNKASILAQRGGSGALSSASLQASLRNIDREGAEAIRRRELNFGNHLRNLGIEIENTTITTTGLNNQAFNNINLTASGTGTSLKLLSTGLNAFNKFGFTIDPKSGKYIPRWGSN